MSEILSAREDIAMQAAAAFHLYISHPHDHRAVNVRAECLEWTGNQILETFIRFPLAISRFLIQTTNNSLSEYSEEAVDPKLKSLTSYVNCRQAMLNSDFKVFDACPQIARQFGMAPSDNRSWCQWIPLKHPPIFATQHSVRKQKIADYRKTFSATLMNPKLSSQILTRINGSELWERVNRDNGASSIIEESLFPFWDDDFDENKDDCPF